MSDLDEILARALSLGEEGRWQEAAEGLREVLPQYGEDAALHCWLGVAERELGMDGIAYERFKTALGLQPEDPMILALAGSGVAAFDDPDAETALRAASILGPQMAEARWRYGAYLSREGMLEEALKELAVALELAPDEAVIQLEMGVAMALNGDLDGAADHFGTAVTLVPQDGWPRILLGLAEVERGQFPEADAELEAGARLRPEDAEAQFLAALAAAVNGREGVAYEMVERGRMVSDEQDLPLAAEVEDRIDDGPEAAEEMLVGEMSPGAFRDRLMARP